MVRKAPLYPHVPKSKAKSGFRPTEEMGIAAVARLHVIKAIEELDIAGKLLPSGGRTKDVLDLFPRANDLLNHINEDLEDISEGVPFRHG